MLAEGNVFAIVAVKDIAAGKKFYGETLGLKQVDENPGGVAYQSGTGKIFIYESKENAGTNKATCAAWEVKDVDGTVAELKSKGVNFEHYPDMPGVTIQGDVHIMGPMQVAWFKDPDGNIISVGNV